MLASCGLRAKSKKGPQPRADRLPTPTSFDLFEVNGRTNMQWARRYLLVEDLVIWVRFNLNLATPNMRKKHSESDKMGKSRQYVYEHLAIGKMKHPLERDDPLFTRASYNDASMMTQLVFGKYPEFQALVADVMKSLHEYMPNAGKEITLPDIMVDLPASSHPKIREMREVLILHNPARLDDNAWLDTQLVGLILRYKCMGGFGDNLHGSVPDTWTTELGPGFVECFASPFNHKFETYYSIFEQDKVFGSKGNFFAELQPKGYVLPDGKYEINPPWNNEMYQAVQMILANSMRSRTIQAIIVGPDWTKTTWIPGITDLLNIPGYKTNSYTGAKRIAYVNDAMLTDFPANTVYWVISKTYIDQRMLDRLDLPRPVSSSRPAATPLYTRPFDDD
jgi:hypothetical protein